MPGGLDSTTQISLVGINVWDEDVEEKFRVFGQSSAVRTVLCPWADHISLVVAMGGYSGYNNANAYNYATPFPYPNAPGILYYNGVDVKGYGTRSNNSTGGMVGYKYARMRLLFNSLSYDPNTSGQLQIDYSVEDIILPQLTADSIGPNGALQVNGMPLWKFVNTGNGVNAAQIPSLKIVTVTLTSLVFNLLTIPTQLLSSYAGCVNSVPFLSAPEGTVRFMGAKSSRRPNFANVETWDLTLPFVYNPFGWQTVYNPQTGKFEKIVDQNGKPPFLEKDLNAVYQSGNAFTLANASSPGGITNQLPGTLSGS